MISNTGFWSNDDLSHHAFSPELAKYISEFFNDKEKKVYDFGCGQGKYLEYLFLNGFKNLTGFEGDPPKEKYFNNIIKQDLTIDFTNPVLDVFSIPKLEKGNCIFLEVGEHVPSEFEEILLKNVTNLCDGKLVMSWAVEGQGGYGHVNCQNNDIVIPKIEKFGFVFNTNETIKVRSLNHSTAPWFYNTLMVFEKDKTK
jgi:SAM-dependent methyltransferase